MSDAYCAKYLKQTKCTIITSQDSNERLLRTIFSKTLSPIHRIRKMRPTSYSLVAHIFTRSAGPAYY